MAFFGPAPPSPELRLSLDAFKHGLREQGYEAGRNVTVELTVLTNKEERVSDLAADIVRRKPDVVFAIASTGVDAVRKVGPATPIVALDLETDPVVSGIAASLARFGGSVTGIFSDLPGLAGKWLELLKEVSPLTTRVAILWGTATGRVPLAAAEGSARALRVQL